MTVLYTAIFGGSDSLKPPPLGPDRCVCYTDDRSLSGQGWEIVYQSPTDFPRRQARLVKLGSHRLFPEAERAVWADGSIRILDWSLLLHDAGDADIACLRHPDRRTCYEEGAKVIELKIGGRVNVTRALNRFRSEGFAPTELSTTGLLVRRSTPAVVRMNMLWQELLETYGINDQVHLDYCAWKAGATRGWLTGHYLDNAYMVYDRRDHRARRRPQYLPDPEESPRDLAG